MKWFSQQDSPTGALVIDGPVWGLAVGSLGPVVAGLIVSALQRDPAALGFGIGAGLVGAFIGPLIGCVAGVVAGVIIAVWAKAGARPSIAAVGTLVPTLLGPLALAALSGQDALVGVGSLVVVAGVPLTVDVVRLVRRPTWSGRRGDVVRRRSPAEPTTSAAEP